jgi:hypothetical protein
MGRFDFRDLLKLGAADILRYDGTGENQAKDEDETANLKHGKPPPELGYCTPHLMRIIQLQWSIS